MKIYTKNGDLGKTSLIGKRNVPKNDPVFEVLGTLDELSASLGLVYLTKSKEIQEEIYHIQRDLFSLGAYFAGDPKQKEKVNFKKRTQELENTIDAFDATLSQLKNFILPGGSPPSAQLHYCRALCRRLERHTFVYLNANDLLKKDDEILAYVNRLSDLLFVLARAVNQRLGIADVIWEG